VALNKEWHRLNRMPLRATREQRIKWHVVHTRVCGCCEIPESVRADVERLLKSRK
jgi:hypothetical protein